MTIQQITKEVNKRRPLSNRQVRRYVNRLKIKPLASVRIKPVQYPPDTAGIILQQLSGSIVTMPQLRSERARAQKARAA